MLPGNSDGINIQQEIDAINTHLTEVDAAFVNVAEDISSILERLETAELQLEDFEDQRLLFTDGGLSAVQLISLGTDAYQLLPGFDNKVTIIDNIRFRIRSFGGEVWTGNAPSIKIGWEPQIAGGSHAAEYFGTADFWAPTGSPTPKTGYLIGGMDDMLFDGLFSNASGRAIYFKLSEAVTGSGYYLLWNIDYRLRTDYG